MSEPENNTNDLLNTAKEKLYAESVVTSTDFEDGCC